MRMRGCGAASTFRPGDGPDPRHLRCVRGPDQTCSSVASSLATASAPSPDEELQRTAGFQGVERGEQLGGVRR